MKQRNNSDCGITCVAQLSGKSYREVKIRFGNVRGGMERHGFEWILGAFCSWVRKRAKRQTVAEFVICHPSGRFAVCCSKFMLSHVVAIIDGKISGWDCGNFDVCRIYEVNGDKPC